MRGRRVRSAGGRIIQIGSDVFERSAHGMSAYSAAKSAQFSLTHSWARELGPLGITVNVVAPGWIPVERHAAVDPQSVENYRRAVPLGRMGRPEDIAGTVAWLLSEDARGVTGQAIDQNGGAWVG